MGQVSRALGVQRHSGDKLAAAMTKGVLWKCHFWSLNHHSMIGFMRLRALQTELFPHMEQFHNAGNPSPKANHQEGELRIHVTHHREAPLTAGS